ncbi:mitochondrial 54S ribosomal protein uL22m [Aspergillus clavatus NRRL 1]|uniref:Mitochondrial ribosomal protein subunit L22 n=1 Tax=Aspergillus clavatus (strain ATCC 1007 / CBS 513.65 / DSM 816 / NCTC 3887 / NRRL 1 / QM 1276 / 107) TaxID=344612 RepID=A1CFG9_ASPCL|nr:uncharacterized protein ACLA_093170 [Aspergillus clavatus NRRL 1]EAW11618.1 conserved hypothetical protein [Aspergillus clavatus NRRL 1]
MATMGAVYPYGRLLQTARTGIAFVPRRTLTYSLPRRSQQDGNNGPNDKPEDQSKPSALSSIKDFFFGGRSAAAKPKITRRATAPPKREGSLSADSIFAEDEATPKLIASGRTPAARKGAEVVEGEEEMVYEVESRNRGNMAAVLDPRPKARMRWERKMVVRELRRRGRLTKTEQIMRTERESLSKSHWFKTSVKKLGPLARQIVGKNIDEAMLQMRFSKKKAAKDILEHLQHAKNVAIVRSGMGLGEATGDKPVTVTLKSGERKKIFNPSSIYIDQAWVNRGPYGVDYDHRARGQINRLRPPYTSLTVLLKEENTRIREWQDRESEALRKRKAQLWTQLPDRKISAQNQYYSW